MPAPAEVHRLLPADRPVVGVFENLHWHRYTDAYREAFLANVQALADQFPEVTFIVKPHHAGLWLTKRHQGERPDSPNLLIADPQLPEWEQHTASALLGRLTAVITSPSTVALDAALQGLPVAVVAEDLKLENYRPLPLLAGQADWTAFIRDSFDADKRPDLEQAARQFIDRTVLPGDAAARIVADLRETAGE